MITRCWLSLGRALKTTDRDIILPLCSKAVVAATSRILCAALVAASQEGAERGRTVIVGDGADALRREAEGWDSDLERECYQGVQNREGRGRAESGAARLILP